MPATMTIPPTSSSISFAFGMYTLVDRCGLHYVTVCTTALVMGLVLFYRSPNDLTFFVFCVGLFCGQVRRRTKLATSPSVWWTPPSLLSSLQLIILFFVMSSLSLSFCELNLSFFASPFSPIFVALCSTAFLFLSYTSPLVEAQVLGFDVNWCFVVASVYVAYYAVIELPGVAGPLAAVMAALEQTL